LSKDKSFHFNKQLFGAFYDCVRLCAGWKPAFRTMEAELPPNLRHSLFVRYAQRGEIVIGNILYYKNIVVLLCHQYPRSLFTMLKYAGRFILNSMKVNYSKVCTLPQDLIPLLKKRGLIIADEQRTISYLINIGYFRLSAYL
jgi:hypothetical protein